MSARVSAFAISRRDRRLDALQPVDEMLEAAERIERAAQELQTLNAILQQVDKSITAAAKRAVKRAGSWPLRLNSRQARRGL
jgi:type II secretory pathway component PulJ